MKEIKCLLCGENQNRKLFDKKGVGFLLCLKCGLVFLEKKVTSSNLYEDIYFNIDYDKGQVIGYRDYLADKAIFDKYFATRLDMIESYQKPGRILDIGCAFGFFLALAKKRGWQVYGVEPAKKPALFARRKYRLNILNDPVEKVSFGKESFDVVALFQTIEHLADPISVLKKIKQWLKKDGLIVISTPNQRSYLARLMGKYWFEYKPDEHFFYFSPETLTRLLLKTGFKNPIYKRDSFPFSIKYISERILYYLGLDNVKKLVGKVDLKKGFFSKPLVPLYFGGMICVARKE